VPVRAHIPPLPPSCAKQKASLPPVVIGEDKGVFGLKNRAVAALRGRQIDNCVTAYREAERLNEQLPQAQEEGQE
jgi:hypothetical protein